VKRTNLAALEAHYLLPFGLYSARNRQVEMQQLQLQLQQMEQHVLLQQNSYQL